ncbi:NAD(P)-binding protein, partial [Fistulina hepatica ATCC 64428]
VTGASGCIAMHMVNQLLEAGYRVRGSARGKRLEGLKKAFAKTDRFEAIDIPDIASSNLTHAFEGVDALLHTAAPLPGEASTEVALNHAVDGTLHVLTAAKKAGIRRIVVTGSLFAYSGTAARQLKHAEDMWGVYAVEKKFTEVAVVDFAKENLDTSVTISTFATVASPL